MNARKASVTLSGHKDYGFLGSGLLLAILLTFLFDTTPGLGQNLTDADPASITGLLSFTIEAIVEFIAKFKYANLFDALVDICRQWFTNSATGDFTAALADGLSEATNFLFSSETFLNSTRGALWSKSMGIAWILLPLILILTIASVLKNGAALISPDIREQIVRLLVSVGLAASSYFVMNKLCELSGAVAARLIGLGTVESNSIGIELLNALYMSGLSNASSYLLDLLFVLLKLFFFLMVFISLLFAGISVQISFFILIVLAPIVFIVSAYGELCWLRSLWIKSYVYNCLMLPINALLLVVMLSSKSHLRASNNSGAILASLIINLTMSCILVSINGQVISGLYSGILETLQKGTKAVKAIAHLAVYIARLITSGGISSVAGVGSFRMIGEKTSDIAGNLKSLKSPKVSDLGKFQSGKHGKSEEKSSPLYRNQPIVVREINRAASQMADQYNISPSSMEQIKTNAVRAYLAVNQSDAGQNISTDETDRVQVISSYMEAQIMFAQGSQAPSAESDSGSSAQITGVGISIALFQNPAISDTELNNMLKAG